MYARIEPDVKEQAEGILSALGIPASNAINMFYKQIIMNRGLPFEVKIPTAKPINVEELSEVELNAELEKGYADMETRLVTVILVMYAGRDVDDQLINYTV